MRNYRGRIESVATGGLCDDAVWRVVVTESWDPVYDETETTILTAIVGDIDTRSEEAGRG